MANWDSETKDNFIHGIPLHRAHELRRKNDGEGENGKVAYNSPTLEWVILIFILPILSVSSIVFDESEMKNNTLMHAFAEYDAVAFKLLH